MKIIQMILLGIMSSIPYSDAQTPGNELTASYLRLKNALVNDSPEQASHYAGNFENLLSKYHDNTAKGALFYDVLKKTAVQIKESTSIELQRKSFSELSEAFYKLLKSQKLNKDTLYYQYCPMKKAGWISEEKAIKNPYYGRKMLTCGSVKETVK